MTNSTVGRHRRPGRLSTASTTLTRTAAVAATTTGLFAGAAIPAGATGDVASDKAKDAGTVDSLFRAADSVQAEVAAVDLPAVAAVAPKTLPTVVTPTTFGTSGFSGRTIEVQRPAARAEVAPATQAAPAAETRVETQVAARQTETSSRSTTRPAAPAAAPAATPAPVQATPAPARPATGGVLGIAAQYVGVPYVWGGSTPAGFDCSGLTSYVFAQVGISLPRTAAAQQSVATPVSNPQPGDLVFYGYPAYHVGIYAGNGMMYDAPRPGKVVSLRPVFAGVSGYGRVG